MIWELLHPAVTPEHLGALPTMLSEFNTAPAKQQLDHGYAFAGGWQPFKGFVLNKDNSLSYPGDPPLRPIASAQLRDELVLLYDGNWVAIIQPDRSFEVTRMS
jgi:hypothetical protein